MSRHRKKNPAVSLFFSVWRDLSVQLDYWFDDVEKDRWKRMRRQTREKTWSHLLPLETTQFKRAARALQISSISIVIVHVLRRYRHFLSALHRIAATSIVSQHQQNKPIDENYCTWPISFSHHLSLFQVFRYLKSTQFQRAREQTNKQNDNKHKVNPIPTPL